jgi:heat shock protein HslJ
MAIAALMVTACSGSGEAAVTGTVTYRQRIALPEDAVITVKIEDVSLMDVPAKTIGEQVIETEGKQVPFPYDVAYNEDDIDERNTYSMGVRIEDSTGKLLFISDTMTPVITNGNPTEDVEIVVVPVGGGAQAGPAPSLTGTVWTLTALGDKGRLFGTTVTAEFKEDGALTGNSGCNGYNTTYEVDGNNIEISDMIAGTAMACPGPIMAQETAYLGALPTAATYEIQGDELVLWDDGGDAVLTYAVEKQGLAGTSWQVISYNNGKGGVVSVILDTEITANFGEDGQVTGSGGCNNYFGPYETQGDNISMGPFGATRMMCSEPEGLMDQESQYLAALESAATYKIEGGKLSMRTAEGSMAVNFQRAVGP